MNLKQMYDLRVLWRSSRNKVVHKETALAVLDEAIRLAQSRGKKHVVALGGTNTQGDPPKGA